MRRYSAFLLLLSLAACLPFNYAPPPPTAEQLPIIYTPALNWMQGILNACALTNPGAAITVEVRPASDLEIGPDEVFLRLGTAPQGLPEYTRATLLGHEQIVIIASPEITPSQLEFPDVQMLYTSLTPEFQVWQYPQGSELYEIFTEHLLLGDKTTPHALVAPHPESMLEIISSQPNGVGYIPQSFLPKEHTMSVSDVGSPTGFFQPIIALTVEEPAGLTRQYLHCLSEALP